MLDFLSRTAIDADPAEFWFFAAFAAMFTVLSVRQGLAAFWKLRLVLDTPTARIRSAPQGYVELKGQALALRGPILAKLSGSPCVWYRYQVQERRGSSGKERWVTIERGDAGRPFLLDDGSGRCLVDPAQADLRCRIHKTWYSAQAGGAAQDRPWQILAWRHHPRRYRLTEDRILDQEPVYVLGNLQTPRRDVRERQRLTRHLLAQWKRNPERLRVFDRNGDGDIDAAEWEQARAQAAHLAQQAEARLAMEPVLARVGPTDDARHPFVVSTEDEGAMTRRLRLTAFGGTLLGGLIGIGLAHAVLVRLAG
ncbi:hypothetical protein F2Q65_09750 [Thiohalocapsa marina]|uniref:EF-hand domain-containing protein n=1 Tax=Thiohalocapsa marina TaxID=424902 RepID=A0A5M8FSJ5_9GAMM|nr:GIDE domain-containing protein [Thiohalocapsa marina]KAA6185182.1 hypothetical protein F2Q65_09750 [Thiohalocapsa marina]